MIGHVRLGCTITSRTLQSSWYRKSFFLPYTCWYKKTNSCNGKWTSFTQTSSCNVKPSSLFWDKRTIGSKSNFEKILTIQRNNEPPVVNSKAFSEVKVDISKLPATYASLSKWYLTLFVVMTMDAGYCLAPVPFDHFTFFVVTVGTALCSCCANTLNQIAEVPYDAQMDRTRNRPLVRGIISPLHAFTFSSIAGITGVSLLYAGGNSLTAALGLANIVLYAAIYTPLKRKHWSNTWAGSLVGAIPPIMGWTAATGNIDIGAFIFAGILYAWQFPHFYALAWRRRGDYARGSYHMLPLSHPEATKYVVTAHSIGLWALSLGAPVAGVTSPAFLWLSLPLNIWLTRDSIAFQRNGSSKSAQKLYKCSLYYIMLISFALIIDRKVLSKWTSREENDSKVPITCSVQKDSYY